MTDFFSKFFKKEKKRKQLEENVAKGKIAEEMYEADATMSGIKYKRTGKGSDYEETHYDPLTGKKSKRLVLTDFLSWKKNENSSVSSCEYS